MAENNSVSLETLEEQLGDNITGNHWETLEDQQKQLSEAVSQLTATRTQLEEQLAAVRNNLATNAGALQYANALIQSITGEEQPSVDDVVAAEEATEEEEVAL